jgi:metal-responsive CopG/Arc/MetJ family transcriptional regulator
MTIVLALDTTLLKNVDHLIAQRRFRDRREAIESALVEMLARLGRTRLAEECAKLDRSEERGMADEASGPRF